MEQAQLCLGVVASLFLLPLLVGVVLGFGTVCADPV